MKKHLRSISLSGLMLILCFVFVVTAYADDAPNMLPKKKDLKNIVLIVHKGETAEDGEYFPTGTQISKIKVSKKAIKVSKETRDGIPYLSIRTKRAVKGKVSFTATYNGKKQNYNITVTAVKYKNPFKSFKIGKTDYAKRFNNDASTFFLEKGVSGKLSIKMNKGFKLAELYLSTGKIKNNRNITLNEGSQIALYYYNKSISKIVGADFLIPLEVMDNTKNEE